MIRIISGMTVVFLNNGIIQVVHHRTFVMIIAVCNVKVSVGVCSKNVIVTTSVSFGILCTYTIDRIHVFRDYPLAKARATVTLNVKFIIIYNVIMAHVDAIMLIFGMEADVNRREIIQIRV